MAQGGYGFGNQPKGLLRTLKLRPLRPSSAVPALLTTEVTDSDEPPERTSRPAVIGHTQDVGKLPNEIKEIHEVIEL